MRFIMRVTFPPAKFNAAVYDGSAGEKLGRIMAEIRPEAAYFTSMNGSRGGYIIVNMEKTSEMPRFAEPFFLLFDADVEFLPSMTPEDLQQGDLVSMGKQWQ